MVAESFGAIYERNAINVAFPILEGRLKKSGIKDGDELEIDFATGAVRNLGSSQEYRLAPFSEVQKEIYLRGGLL